MKSELAGAIWGKNESTNIRLQFDNQNEGDRVIESHGVNVYIDPKSYLYLMGTQIDFVDELNQSGFKFVNPNAKRTCGCGESFGV